VLVTRPTCSSRAASTNSTGGLYRGAVMGRPAWKWSNRSTIDEDGRLRSGP
jgi:hypothetical protein